MASTAHVFWDEVWRTGRGRQPWEVPDHWVMLLAAEARDRRITRVLDLGCGVGRHALYLRSQGLEVCAVDRSAAAVEHVEQVADSVGTDITAMVADYTEVPFPDASFDLVLAFNVLYHGDERTLLTAQREVARVLRGPRVLASTMLSKRNVEFGRGEEISPNTFRQPDATDDKIHPHLYCDARDLVRLHPDLNLLAAADRVQSGPGSFHWYCEFEGAA
jgi:SAM-dependent methyltransferase